MQELEDLKTKLILILHHRMVDRCIMKKSTLKVERQDNDDHDQPTTTVVARNQQVKMVVLDKSDQQQLMD